MILGLLVLFPLPGMSPPMASVGYILLIFNLLRPIKYHLCRVLQLPSASLLLTHRAAQPSSSSSSQESSSSLPMSLCAGLWETEASSRRRLGNVTLAPTDSQEEGEQDSTQRLSTALSSTGPPPAEWRTGLTRLPALNVRGPWEEMRRQERAHSSTWWMAVSSWPVREHLLA